MAFEHERQEWRAALRNARPAPCPPGKHRMTRFGGGGICTKCGDTIGGDEL